MPASGKSAIQLYRSTTAGTRPSSLAAGELFLNQTDAVLCYPDSNGNVQTVYLSDGRGLPKTVTGSTYTVLNTDDWLIFTTTTACTVTLPTPAAANAGRTLNVKNLGTVGVNSASSNVRPIGSATTGTAILGATAGKWATLVSDGSVWTIMAAN